MENMQINAVPNNDNIPNIFSLVVIEATMFLSTSMRDIIKWKARIANHYVL